TIYDPTTRVYFSGAVQSGFDWLDDSTFIWPKRDAKGKLVEWERFDVKSGSVQPFFDRAALEHSLEQAGVSADEAASAAKASSLRFDAKKSAIVIEAAGDLFLYSIAKQTATRLTSTPAAEELPEFSPDGKWVAFVRGNNLYTIDVATARERQLTTDGSATILNGALDWVYEEEVYGRGTKRGFWWSPDSSRIAFLRTDEAGVPVYPNVDQVPYHPAAEPQFYPKAGDPNPHVRLLVAPAGGGALANVDNERYSAADFLIVRVAWTHDGKALTYQVQNREQTWLDLDQVDPAGGAPKTLIHETTKAWVEAIENPEWLADGSFLWQSERSGFRHLYHYKADGTLLRQVTSGDWEVRDLHGIDERNGEKNGWVYFAGTERSPIGLDLYRVKLDGSGLQRISDAPGTHAAKFNPSLTYYVDNWSDINTPNQARLHRADGTLAKVVDANLSSALAEYDLPKPEFLQVKARDGFVLEALMIKPSSFDPSKKYPVYEYHYGGPHAQQVTNAWKGANLQFLQLIAQQGVVVWICDNRAASGKGAVSAWTLYKHFGETELRDMEDGLAWLKSQPFVDGSRIMTYGWSYGGFMTSYALTHSKTFIAGISGGTVADWRDYDSIYTERYMLMPQNNADAYKSSSPRWAAKDLHGNLLLLHGAVDDNVHPQNTIQFAYELEKAQMPFEMKFYPKQQHGVREPALVYDLQKTILGFVKANLKP
ncbi:MAG TPA: S9 family peptidase, partial [Thermoanaerobaculia bacterium]|nr:S9 family peptidase [Thermoanaerobaculia bacterium]